MSAISAQPTAADLELFTRPCSHCKAAILWAKTKTADPKSTGEWMPLDAAPNERGNVLLIGNDDPRHFPWAVVYSTPRKRAAMRAGGWVFYIHHSLSCQYADQWQRGPKSMRPAPTGVRKAPPPQPVDTGVQESLL